MFAKSKNHKIVKSFNRSIILAMVSGAIICSASFAEKSGVTNSITDDVISKKIKYISEEKRKNLKNAKMKITANPAVDEFVITDSVLLKDAKPVGLCLKGTISKWSPWSSNMQNLWNSVVSFEPFLFTQNWEFKTGLEGSTEDYLEVRGDNVGLTYWAVYPDDFWNGAEMFLYRQDGNMMKEIHHTTVKKWEVLKDGKKKKPYGIGHLDGRLYYADKGPKAKNGDILLIKMVRSTYPKTPKSDINGKPFKNYKQGGIKGVTFDNGVNWELDTSTYAPENGSTCSMKMTLPKSEKPSGFYHYYFSNHKAWIGNFTPGKDYKMEVWLKQKGLTAPVTIRTGHFITKEITVSDKWQKVSIDIPKMKLKELKDCEFRLGSASAGTLWVDNCIIYQTDTKPFAILPKFIKEMKSFKPEILRWQNGGMITAPGIDGWLNSGFRENLNVQSGRINSAIGVGLPVYLELCKELNANAWLNLPVYSKKESLKLMEYLCGPTNTPYGKKRAELGHPNPWTDDFDEIVIEFANEAWNGMFTPLYFGQEKYAALANMIYSDMKSSPYYKKNKNNFLFCAGGRVGFTGRFKKGKASDWGSVQIQDCTSADMYAYSDYIGGWDGITIPGDIPEKLYQSQLLYPCNFIDPNLKKLVETVEILKRTPGKSKNPIQLGVYEFGPGYALPNGNRPFIQMAEDLGKSLALGVATLDTSMKYLENGFQAPQAFFKFGGGWNFTTHSDIQLKHPTPAYLALKMRNLHCSGDMMKVKNKAVKTVDIPDMMGYKRSKNDTYSERVIKGVSNIVMSSCYAFKDGDTYSFIVLNRNVDESRKTKITLPVEVAKTAKLYKLTGKPWDTNLTDINVKIQEETITNFSKNYTFDMPASSVYIFVVKVK